MSTVLYTGAFIAALVMFVMLIARYKSRVSIYYFLFFASAVIYNFGNMQMSASSNLEAAVYANQTAYLGGSYLPFFMFMCVADLCKYKVKKIFQIIFMAYTTGMFAAVSTIGLAPWYYSSVGFVKENGISILTKEYGPMHIMYPVYMIAVIVISITMVILSFRKKRDISYVTSITLILVLAFSAVVYTVEKLMDLKFELLPSAILVSLLGTLILLNRISMYEVTAISARSMTDSLSYGFVICDSNGKFLGADEAAKLWFTEVGELGIDYVIKREDTDLLKQIGKWTRGEDDTEVVYIERDGRIYEAKHSLVKECRHHNVHCIYLRDDTKQQQFTRLVQQYNETLEKDVEAKTENIRKIQKDILISMASIVENRDSNTGGHIARTSDIVRIFVDYLQKNKDYPELTDHMARSIVEAAPLHDFGKIAIPDVILNKPGKFTDEEYEKMKEHSAKGAVIVRQILKHSDDDRFRHIAVNVAHYHHEKWDGNGYPEKIKGTDIPFEARVMALADVFDALVSKRVYKESMGFDKAFSIIEESSGTHFDPQLCADFLECRKQLEDLYNSYTD